MKSDGFFIDVELLVRAAEAGMSVGETPVVFSYVDPTSVRMISHGARMIADALRLRKELSPASRRAQSQEPESVKQKNEDVPAGPGVAPEAVPAAAPAPLPAPAA